MRVALSQPSGLKSSARASSKNVVNAKKPIRSVIAAANDGARVHEASDASDAPRTLSRRGLLLASSATTAAMFACPCCNEIAAQASGFSYGDVSGPASWPGVCSSGQRQSPVDVALPAGGSGITEGQAHSPFGDLSFNYGHFENVSVLNTGHGTMQVNFQAGNLITAPIEAGTTTTSPVALELELLQYHFHTPSEHALSGKRYAMEAHLVHRNKATGGLAVVGVLMQPGGSVPNAALQAGLDFAPTEHGQSKPARAVSPSALLPPRTKGLRPYVHYAGSLTTPPCSEGVDWFVMTTPIKVPDKQVIDFMQFAGDGLTYPRTARPLQPLNGREFEYKL